jgi:hypothetical protein
MNMAEAFRNPVSGNAARRENRALRNCKPHIECILRSGGDVIEAAYSALKDGRADEKLVVKLVSMIKNAERNGCRIDAEALVGNYTTKIDNNIIQLLLDRVNRVVSECDGEVSRKIMAVSWTGMERNHGAADAIPEVLMNIYGMVGRDSFLSMSQDRLLEMVEKSLMESPDFCPKTISRRMRTKIRSGHFDHIKEAREVKCFIDEQGDFKQQAPLDCGGTYESGTAGADGSGFDLRAISLPPENQNAGALSEGPGPKGDIQPAYEPSSQFQIISDVLRSAEKSRELQTEKTARVLPSAGAELEAGQESAGNTCEKAKESPGCKAPTSIKREDINPAIRLIGLAKTLAGNLSKASATQNRQNTKAKDHCLSSGAKGKTKSAPRGCEERKRVEKVVGRADDERLEKQEHHKSKAKRNGTGSHPAGTGRSARPMIQTPRLSSADQEEIRKQMKETHGGREARGRRNAQRRNQHSGNRMKKALASFKIIGEGIIKAVKSSKAANSKAAKAKPYSKKEAVTSGKHTKGGEKFGKLQERKKSPKSGGREILRAGRNYKRKSTVAERIAHAVLVKKSGPRDLVISMGAGGHCTKKAMKDRAGRREKGRKQEEPACRSQRTRPQERSARRAPVPEILFKLGIQ